MDIEGFRKAGYAAVDRICDYYASLSTLPVSSAVAPGFLSHSIPSDPPNDPEEWETIDSDYHSIIMPGITHWQHPNFYAYFPCNASFPGAIADLYCAAISNPGFNWSVSPSVTELEILMVDWVARMLGLDEQWLSTSKSGTGGGVILGSASEVALTVAIAARERCIRILADRFPMPMPTTAQTTHVDGERANEVVQGQSVYVEPEPNLALHSKSAAGAAAQVREPSTVRANTSVAQWRAKLTSQLVVYGTTQTHSIAAKAALILGLEFRALHVAAPHYSLDAATLSQALREDTQQGRIPFLLIATIGTTSSGAVDHLSEIVEVVHQYPTLWLHVDAAYAGVCLSLPELRSAMHLGAINSGKVDSFSTNLHKWGLVQFDCSPVFLRDRGHFSRALTITPEYLRTKHGDAGDVLDLRNLQISLGRRFRSLKIWFVLRSYGVSGFQQHLRSTIELAHCFETLVRQDKSRLFQIVAPPRWALVVFRLKSPHDQQDVQQSERLDSLNLLFWQQLQQLTAEFVLTQTKLPGIGICLRFVVGSPQTRLHHVESTWNRISQTALKTWAKFNDTSTVS